MAKYDNTLKREDKRIFSYDKDNDILVIHKGFSVDEKFKGNIEVGDLILDVSTRGRIRGVEINNTNMFLQNITLNDFANIVDANFSSSTTPNGIVISLLFKFKNKTELPATIAVPLEAPIM
jgi:uncharacterized protein YuzE